MVLSMAGIGLCARPSTGLRMTAARGLCSAGLLRF
jgi:hypothetical protein